jgi:hypothetical protein
MDRRARRVTGVILVAVQFGALSLPSRWSARSGAAAALAATRTTCAPGKLRTTVADGLAGTGHVSSVILVRNAGPGPCRLMGYPAVRFRNGTGVEVARGIPTPHGFTGGLPVGAPIPVVDLEPGESASAVMEGTDMPTGTATSCPSYASYTIALPGWPGTTTIDHSYGGCSDVQVHPFVLGFNGSFPSGLVVGRAPTCAATGSSDGPGPFVPIAAWSGGHVAGMVIIAASPTAPQPYRLILKPGRYRIRSGPAPARPDEVVRAGRTLRLGTYGGCSRPPGAPTPGGLPGATTTTTSSS